MLEEIKNFLDEHGKVHTWPSKMKKKIAVIDYLATKFEEELEYTEQEVNEIIDQWHTFSDYFILRRSLVELNKLGRAKDGSKYWKIEDENEE
jgi:hypothetical protein